MILQEVCGVRPAHRLVGLHDLKQPWLLPCCFLAHEGLLAPLSFQGLEGLLAEGELALFSFEGGYAVRVVQ